MMFLILVIGLVFLYFKKSNVPCKSANRAYIIIISILLILQSGLRNVAVGSDTFAYYGFFKSVIKLSWQDIEKQVLLYYGLGIGKDPGYIVFEKLFQYVSHDYQLFLLFIATLFFSSLGYFIYKNSISILDIIVSFLMYSTLFYAFFSITGHRQTIATAVSLFCFELLKRKQLFFYVILILLASTIHKSVLILLPFYFIGNWVNYKWFFISVFLSFPFLMLFRYNIAELLVSIADSKAYEQYKNFEGAGTFTFTLMILLISIATLWRLNSINNLSHVNKYIILAFGFGLAFTPLTWVNPSLMRVVQYFSIFMLALVPMILKSFQRKNKENAGIIYFCAIITMFLLTIKAGWGSEYKFFWQHMELGDNY